MNSTPALTRRYYIDNLRAAIVLLLVPFHTFMMYNNWGEEFYVYSHPLGFPSLMLQLIWPWFMPALFTLAGISAAFSLEKRSVGRFVQERFTRLFVPLVLGILIVIPVQTYYAECFHNGYTGSYFAQYRLFFGKVTDLTGYTGGFTPAQLWFILYLFVISLAAVPVIILLKKFASLNRKPLPLIGVFLLGLCVMIFRPLLNIGGKSIVEYFLYFLLGYLFLSKDEALDSLQRRRILFGSIAGVLFAVLVVSLATGKTGTITLGILFQAYAWSTILFFIGCFKRRMNHSGPVARYLARSSFMFYVLHQSALVMVAFYLLRLNLPPAAEIPLIIIAGYVTTFAAYELWRRAVAMIRLPGKNGKTAHS